MKVLKTPYLLSLMWSRALYVGTFNYNSNLPPSLASRIQNYNHTSNLVTLPLS